MLNLETSMGCQRLTYHQKTSSKTESTPIFKIGQKQGGDYQVFGVQLDGRTHQSSDYRYGFNGMEKDDEIKGEGNSVNYKYRMHDPRIGRFFAVDPISYKFPYYSPYHFTSNSPIISVDLEGLQSSVRLNYPELTVTIDAASDGRLLIKREQIIQIQKQYPNNISGADATWGVKDLREGGLWNIKCSNCGTKGTERGYILLKLPTAPAIRLVPVVIPAEKETVLVPNVIPKTILNTNGESKTSIDLGFHLMTGASTAKKDVNEEILKMREALIKGLDEGEFEELRITKISVSYKSGSSVRSIEEVKSMIRNAFPDADIDFDPGLSTTSSDLWNISIDEYQKDEIVGYEEVEVVVSPERIENQKSTVKAVEIID